MIQIDADTVLTIGLVLLQVGIAGFLITALRSIHWGKDWRLW